MNINDVNIKDNIIYTYVQKEGEKEKENYTKYMVIVQYSAGNTKYSI